MTFPLPSARETRLLEALLLPDDRAAAAWREWREQVPDPVALLKGEVSDRHRALLPLLAVAIEEQRFEVEGTLRTVAGTALLREERRHERSLEISRRAERALAKVDPDVLTVNGAPMALRCWRRPEARHSAGPRFVVTSRNLGAAVEALEALGFEDFVPGARRPAERPAERGAVRLVEESGFSFIVSSRLVDLPTRPPIALRLLDRAETWGEGQAVWRGPGSAHALFEVLVEASLVSGATSMLWVPDALALLSHVPDLDWDELARAAESAVIELPWVAQLRYLAKVFEAPVPKKVTERLARLRRRAHRTDVEEVLARSHSVGRSSAHALIRCAPTRRGRLARAVWIAFPSRRFVRRAYGVDTSTQVLASYARRAARWIGRRLTPRGSGGRSDPRSV